ncbi:MAG: nuclear pore complex subunit [Flavobacteriales bacterium]|nr:DUF1987 domain-containing protein [Bacteroidales bacterium AH-315-I05]PCJ78969.1 MAG: nuclear pore complex subunit [Flavobacteriales bacterium]
MQPLQLEPTYNSPKVNFDAQQGVMELKGRSIPEHANLFYQRLIEWAKEYAASDPPKTVVDVRLDYLNSSSHKFLYDVFEKFEPIAANGHDIIINWHYEEEDEEMRETGEEYSENLKVPFNIIEVEELF